jgi:hypothetical protein
VPRDLILEVLESRTLLDSSGPRIIAAMPNQVRNAGFDHLGVAFDKRRAPGNGRCSPSERGLAVVSARIMARRRRTRPHHHGNE